jgi:radical SAM superfamily enzyme YgiQ (UPF0313 family)
MEPLPAAYIAGLTPRDIPITFWDDRMEQIDFDDRADLVAMSVETYTAKRSYQIASEYRRRGVPVVMGGFHPTLVPEEATQYAEAIVVGEAESLWPELIEDFTQGKMRRIYKSSRRPDISNVMPDRTVFGNRKYFPTGLMDAARGCTYTCDFCAIQSFFNATQNWRSLESLIKEVRLVRKQHKLIFFIDDNIMARPEMAKAFFEALIPLRIKWISQADISTTYDEEILKLMKLSGCQGILIGFESLNSENLKSMNKGFNTTRSGASEAVGKLHKHCLRLYATFLFGYDNDTLDSFGEVIDFCIEHKIFITAFNHVTPFPGTPLYRRLEEEGRLLYEKWWLDDHYRYGQVPFRSSLPPEVIREKCREARTAFYSLRSIFKRLGNPANRSDPAVLAAYLFINLILRNDVSQRYSMPLGDIAFSGEIVKAG